MSYQYHKKEETVMVFIFWLWQKNHLTPAGGANNTAGVHSFTEKIILGRRGLVAVPRFRFGGGRTTYHTAFSSLYTQEMNSCNFQNPTEGFFY